jgi:hypothetical protein
MPDQSAADIEQDAYYNRHLAAEIVSMLPYEPEAADQVLALVREMLHGRRPPPPERESPFDPRSRRIMR